jgi:membrane protein implicated in regulation of membrane protease activity
METWIWWVIAAVAFAIGEIATPGLFFLAPFALAALLTAVVAVAGAGTAASLAVFLVASVGLLTFVRPVARRHLRLPSHVRTGTDALIGRNAVVLERIANSEASGCARIEGAEVWTARAFDDDRVIEPGEHVQVIRIQGATALVD